MSTIQDLIHRMLPDGTGLDPDLPASWDACPFWPPDLFAVAARMVELGSVHTRPWMYAAPGSQGHAALTSRDARRFEIVGQRRRLKGRSNYIDLLWSRLIRAFGETPVAALADTANATHAELQKIVVKLMCIADEACAGMGFGVDDTSGDVAIAAYGAMAMHMRQRQGKVPLPYLPHSFCIQVPDHAACVLPKTRLPSVGCTLRALSRNVALLPPAGIVRAPWLPSAGMADGLLQDDDRLNLLVVPYPYRANGHILRPVTTITPGTARYFCVDFESYAIPGSTGSVKEAAEALSRLIRRAEDEIGTIHGVLFPEYAMPPTIARWLSRHVASNHPGLELFVTGSLARANSSASLVSNLAMTAHYDQGRLLRRWSQNKHHRWKLDGDQIRRYHLGHALDVNDEWWESIDVDQRTCNFSVVRNGLSLAVLICEDLARMDPVMPVIHAVGPSLVVALLMDGPQLEARWPGRYATALAEDPGSSVLTITSTALIRRSASAPGPQVVGLWKEPGGRARELHIGPEDLGLALSLARLPRQEITLDGRRRTVPGGCLSLVSARPVAADQ
ncbi:hypothetical protein V6768_07345 [Tistrella mobilis]